jgi:hypothetical protein
VKATDRRDRTHNPSDETCWVSRLRENFTSGSDGEGLETGRRRTLAGHEGGNPGYRQGQSYYALPRQSFTRQTAFQHIEQNLNSEINTLAYPRAALFGFCVALVAYNVFAVVLAALRSVQDDQTVDETVSSYALVEELGTTYRGMMIAIPAPQWVCFQVFTVVQLATLLKQLAGAIRWSAFRKKRRGPKKPRIKKSYNAKRPHVSTAKVLAAAAAT